MKGFDAEIVMGLSSGDGEEEKKKARYGVRKKVQR